MKVSLFQTDIKWESPEENKIHTKHLIDNSPSADMIILPEMFTTGFCISPKSAAEDADSDTLIWMQNISKEKNAAIGGSVATVDKGLYYNRFYFVKPDGTYVIYDKRHLFTFGGENREYAAGEERVVVEYRGFRILLQICYDLRFPVFVRNRGDYDMIIYAANWPVPRIEAWNTLLRARAIENLCYVAAVNRIGNDPYTTYNGGSVLLNYIGKDIVSAGFGKEAVVSGNVDMDSLLAFRKKFPALDDADGFDLKI